MTIKPQFNEVVSLAKKHYQVEASEVSLLRKGIDNDLFVIKNKDNKFVMRVGKRKLGEMVEYEIKLLNHLYKADVLVPRIIPTIDKKYFILQENGTAILCFEFIQGHSLEVSDEKKPSIKIVKQAGEALGKFHQASISFKFNYSKRRTIYSEFERILDIKNRFEEKVEGFKKFLNEINAYIDWSHQEHGKHGVIHNDFGPENVTVKNNNLTSIIDFDWAGPGPFAKDVGLAVALWSYPDGLEGHWQDVVDEFLYGYNKHSRTQLEFNHKLIKWINFCCLSDTATFFADLPEDNKKIIRVTQCQRYKKFLYFEKLLDGINASK